MVGANPGTALGWAQAIRRELRLPVWLACCVTALWPPFHGMRMRTVLLRWSGVRIGEGSTFAGRVWIAGGTHPESNLAIGRRCFVNDGVRFDTLALISVGDNVDIGHDVAVITSTHELSDGSRRAGELAAQPVTIGDGSWIGARATILPGVRIGDRAVVAAGALVTKSVPDDTLVGGAPARPIRPLTTALLPRP